jgi:hypothetical protein
MTAQKVNLETKVLGEINPKPSNQKLSFAEVNLIGTVIDSHADEIGALDAGLGEVADRVTATEIVADGAAVAVSNVQGQANQNTTDIGTLEDGLSDTQADVTAIQGSLSSVQTVAANAVVALGRVLADGTLSVNRGIASVTKTAPGFYDVFIEGISAATHVAQTTGLIAGGLVQTSHTVGTGKVIVVTAQGLIGGDYPFEITVAKI